MILTSPEEKDNLLYRINEELMAFYDWFSDFSKSVTFMSVFENQNQLLLQKNRALIIQISIGLFHS